MPEQDLNPAATKFISSLVRSLQILCNGQVEFNETIELVGHINVKIDHKYKFDYIVDEHVSKEGEDSSTTFLSNSYHSCRPSKQSNKKSEASALEQDVIFSGIPHNTQRRGKQMKNMHETVEKHSDNSSLDRENAAQNYSVSVEPRDKQYNEHNQMVVKLEGGEDSNDCMVLPASPVDYEGEGNRTETFPVPGTSSSFNDSPGNQTIHSRKRRKAINQRAEDIDQAEEEEEDSEKSSAGTKGINSELLGKFAAYECSYCSIIVTDYPSLNLHSKTCPSPSCKMICLTCGDKMPSKPEMRQHLKFIHNHKTYGCTFCDMMFLSSSGLLSHTKAKHKPDPKTLCQICGQAFHNKANLDGHMNMHLGLKPFKCKKCGKCYGHSKSLLNHEKSCSKSLSSSSKARSQWTRLHNSRSEAQSSGEDKLVCSVNVPSSNQSFSFTEHYPTFTDSKKTANETNLQTVESAGQTYNYNNSSYQTLQSVTIDSINSTSGLSDNVYDQATHDFVLPQVPFDLYPHGILPDHR